MCTAYFLSCVVALWSQVIKFPLEFSLLVKSQSNFPMMHHKVGLRLVIEVINEARSDTNPGSVEIWSLHTSI